MSPHPTVSASATECKATRFSLVAGTAILGASLLLAACATPRESHRVSGPPPPAPTRNVASTQTSVVRTANAQSGDRVQYVTTTDATPGANLIIVTQAPPVPPPEVVVAQPTPHHLWIPGYWTWRHERYEWMAGHWEVPPRPGAQWVNPRWENEGNAYRFFEGYWE
ncbi:MAG: YXWGXW repeat-containing protein [Oceanipulchritudo sp.]